ncbi:MAG: ATP-dependent Clp protease ATP-binding subunit [Bifidobacteriaceae bacterium]|jgi:ATP-dependent Clp protease ATP-binding subunit ClpC|nr:ATP-dependent Clp protease ATP-binding subunit [Bifidobacteriaceae bacterium]
MHERFTESARNAISIAQQEAQGLGHNFIGTEHLMLGLVQEKEGLAGRALLSMGVTPDKLRFEVIDLIGKGNSAPGSQLPFTPRVKGILDASLKGSLTFNHGHIGTEHILLAVIDEGEGVGVQALLKLGISIENLRQTVLNNMGDTSGAAHEPAFAIGMSPADDGKKSILEKYGTNLTLLAEEGKLDPVIGRDSEIERVVQILSRRTKNNPVLTGDPGVGKTAIVEGLAQRIADGDVPSNMADLKVYSIDMGSMIAGTVFRGQFEERVKNLVNEVKSKKDVILFFDEIHTLIGAGSAEGTMDAANILKPALSRGELRTIGATTYEEYRKYFQSDKALDRRFQSVDAAEPSEEETVKILEGLRDAYEQYHGVTYSDDALSSAAYFSKRYIKERFLPDKAIDLIDEAGAKAQITSKLIPKELQSKQKELKKIRKKMDEAVESQNFEEAALLQTKLSTLTAEEVKLKKDYEAKRQEDTSIMSIDSDKIAEVVGSITGIPVMRLTSEESKRLVNMEDEIHKRLIGQDDAVKAVSKTIRRTRSGLKDPNRPSGSFIFAGPTGVGKTELAKTLAQFLFGDEESLIRLDMSEYSMKYESSRLFGSSPGFVGYEEGGQLTEAVRRNPFSVVLFDEIEKAHPDIFNTLLQVLDDGHLTDGQGRKIDFTNTIIIFTTNLGSADINKSLQTGFGNDKDFKSRNQDIKQKVMAALNKSFRPEFLNRIDETIVFNQLSEDEVLKIVDIFEQSIASRLASQNIEIKITDNAKALLAKKGYNPAMGARPLRRVFTSEIEDVLSEKILFGDIKRWDKITLDTDYKPSKKSDNKSDKEADAKFKFIVDNKELKL